MEIHEVIRHIRYVNGYTQDHMADLLDIDPSTYGKMERNQLSFRLEYVYKIADYFQITLNDLINYQSGGVREARPAYNKQQDVYEVDVTLHLKLADKDKMDQLLQTLSNLQNK